MTALAHNGAITVNFPLVPITVLARTIQESDARVTAWAVRKANEQGTIQPDVIGHFAGHKVHYYNPARIPALIEQLSQPDRWGVNTLVLHARHGAGRIVGQGPQPTGSPARLVEFFHSGSVTSASVKDLRVLVPSHVVAKFVGSGRRQFAGAAARRGIYPDYVAPDGRCREFYDETRLDEIRASWNSSERGDEWRPGRVVLDTEGEIAKIARRDAHGRAELRAVDTPAARQTADVRDLHELVSLRELARREQMSRYKLLRLLAAGGVEPAHREGKTFYFDCAKASKAVRARLESERNAVSLAALSTRTGVSEAVLARKVRAGHIRTLGHHATHQIAAAEAQRIERLIRAGSLDHTGICRTHTRGRGGSEVAWWDVARLLEVIQPLSPDGRTVVFGQVAWLCEGTGQRKLQHALDTYIRGMAGNPDRPQARLLLGLIGFLPKEFSRHRVRLLLLASGATEINASLDERLQKLATAGGCDSIRNYDKLRAQVDQGLSALFSPDEEHSYPRKPRRGDDYTEGAVIATCSRSAADIGVIVRVEQECWDCVTRGWHKTLTVRFADGERRLSASTGQQQKQPVLVILTTSEVIRLTDLVRQQDSTAHAHWSERRAS